MDKIKILKQGNQSKILKKKHKTLYNNLNLKSCILFKIESKFSYFCSI